MRYLFTLAGSFLIALCCYVSLIPALAPTPVAAEYWVNELLTIKRSIAKNFETERKIVIASGSSALFSIDASLLSQKLGMPVINYGLMGGMPLERVLEEANAATQPKDTLILALEPDYYCREEMVGFNEWVLRNAIAWDKKHWDTLSLLDKLLSVRYLGLRFPMEMLRTRYEMIFRPQALKERYWALNDEITLKKFNGPEKISDQIYSVYNINKFGDIKNSADNSFNGPAQTADQPIKTCAKSMATISAFVKQQQSKDVSVYFINTPSVAAEGIAHEHIITASRALTAKLARIAPVLDERSELVFQRNFFLNTALHLNSRGRETRTEQLYYSLKRGLKDLH
jgi:hypothetical protein